MARCQGNGARFRGGGVSLLSQTPGLCLPGLVAKGVSPITMETDPECHAGRVPPEPITMETTPDYDAIPEGPRTETALVGPPLTGH